MRKKTWIWIIIVAFIGFGMWFRVRQLKTQKESSVSSAEKEEATPVEITKPTGGKIDLTLSFTGSIKGEDEVQVFSEVTGKLVKYEVAEGDKVEKEETIAMVDRGVTGMKFQTAKVNSPISGVVSSLPLSAGAAISSQVPVAVIVSMDRVHAVFEVGEKNLAQIQVGKKVKIEVDAYPGEVFTGEIIYVSPVLNSYSRTVTYKARIPNQDHRLKPGMYSRISVIADSRYYAITLPEQVLIEDMEKGKFYVFVVKGSKAVKKEVEPGIRTKGYVGIESGIQKDDSIIIKGQEYLKDGQEVKIVI